MAARTPIDFVNMFDDVSAIEDNGLASAPGNANYWKDPSVPRTDFDLEREESKRLFHTSIGLPHPNLGIHNPRVTEWPSLHQSGYWGAMCVSGASQDSVAATRAPETWDPAMNFHTFHDDQSSGDESPLGELSTPPDSGRSPNASIATADMYEWNHAKLHASVTPPPSFLPYYSHGVHPRDIHQPCLGASCPDGQDPAQFGMAPSPYFQYQGTGFPTAPGTEREQSLDVDADVPMPLGMRPGSFVDGTECSDSGSEYSPQLRRPQVLSPQASKVTKATRPGTKAKPKTAGKAAARPAPRKKQASDAASAKAGAHVKCPDCPSTFDSTPALQKHKTAAHTRPFACTFSMYGCAAKFGSKNEWKRHVASQHLRLGIWRCDFEGCHPKPAPASTGAEGAAAAVMRASTSDGEEVEELVYNDFNRKDLFTQHLRRMHLGAIAPTGSPEDKARTERWLRVASDRCLSNLRAPPPRSVCGFCPAGSDGSVFAGEHAWEHRMEHVGKHLEAGGHEASWAEDHGLRAWLCSEGLLEETAEGSWHLTAVAGGRKDYRGR